MKKKEKNQKKLILKKIQITRLNNLKGGDPGELVLRQFQTCQDPENGSTPKETVFTMTV